MTQFEKNKTYFMKSVCDQDCNWICVMLSRTEKFITIYVFDEGVKKVAVRVDDGVEYCLPLGKYSMAPVLRANRIC